MKNVELLAPAGDFECLETALHFGADAVYIGGDLLQLRAKKAGFNREDLQKAVNLAHQKGKKLYVTVNAFANNEEIDACGDYAHFLEDVGVDAAIISDPGVFVAFGEAAPNLERHLSTQANCTNFKTAELFASLGAKRIVLAREMSLEEIRQLRRRLDPSVELEAFIHGAMCMAYSGRCMISSYLIGRSGNRGECAQPCRWEYSIVEKKRPDQMFDLEESESGTAILSSHDLCGADLLSDLAEAGVTSFKIEGRMKSSYYVATAVNAYRNLLDGRFSLEDCKKELDCLQHRPYSTGFYQGALKLGHYNSGEYTGSCKFIANVLEDLGGRIKIRQRGHFCLGETLEVLSPGKEIRSFLVSEIRNEEGETQEKAPHPNQILTLPCDLPLSPGDILRRREA